MSVPNTLPTSGNPEPLTYLCPKCGETMTQNVATAFGRLTLPRLEWEREACGLSRRKLAEKVGTSTSQIHRIERKAQFVNRKQAQDIAEALGVTVEELGTDNTADSGGGHLTDG